MKTNQVATNSVTSGDVSILRKKIFSLRTRALKSRETIRSIIALMSSNISSAILAAVGGLLVARFLGPEETGAFRAFTIPLTYLIFLHLGTWDGLGRQIPYYVGKEMQEKVNTLASTGGAFNLFLSFAISCCFICCATYSLIRHDLYGAFGWFSQAFFCWGVFYGGYLNSTYRTLNHFVTISKIQITQTVLSFGMVFLLPLLGFYGLCSRAALPQCWAVWLLHKRRPLKVSYRFNSKALEELIKIGLPFSFWGNLYTSVWIATEGALVLSLSGASDLGLFSVASVMGHAINSLPTALYQVLTPRVVTNMARDGSIRKANARIMWVTAGLTGFMSLVACAGYFLLDIFVPYFIPKYIAGIPAMKIFLCFPVVTATFLPMNTLFATGRSWLYGRSIIAGIVAFALVVYLLFSAIGGLLAVAFGSLIGRAVRTLAAYVDLVILTRREAKYYV